MAGLCVYTLSKRRPATRPSLPPHTILQALWSLVFALSCNLLVLVLYEIVGIMDPG